MMGVLMTSLRREMELKGLETEEMRGFTVDLGSGFGESSMLFPASEDCIDRW